MAKQTCPKCGTEFPMSEGWARAAVSVLIPAPAVPDMASQVRCPHCQHLFADGDVRHLAPPSRTSRVLVILVFFGLFIWAVSQLL